MHSLYRPILIKLVRLHAVEYIVSYTERSRVGYTVHVSDCPRAYISNYMVNLYQFLTRVTYNRGSVLLWCRCDRLCISGFMDDVTSAHGLITTRKGVQ